VIYTVGHTEGYAARFSDTADGPPTKLGRRADLNGEPYDGGSVWPTREAAQAWLDANPDKPWSVYGVIADWDTDTEPSRVGQEWHDLLVDSLLVDLGTVTPPDENGGHALLR
jgi:hypothetical protein